MFGLNLFDFIGWIEYKGAIRSLESTVFLISCASAVTVDLIVKPSDPIVNQNIELNCSFERTKYTSILDPTLLWYKDESNASVILGTIQGEHSQVLDKTRMSIRDGVLVIKHVTFLDSGVYKSEVTIVDDVPAKNEDTATVLFLDSPSISLSMNGSVLEINCTSGASYPTPKLEIYKNNTDEPLTSGKGKQLEHRTSDLADGYFCRSINEVESKNSEVKAYVYNPTSSPSCCFTVSQAVTDEKYTRLVKGDQLDDKSSLSSSADNLVVIITVPLCIFSAFCVFLAIFCAMYCKKKRLKNCPNGNVKNASCKPSELNLLPTSKAYIMQT